MSTITYILTPAAAWTFLTPPRVCNLTLPPKKLKNFFKLLEIDKKVMYIFIQGRDVGGGPQILY